MSKLEENGLKDTCPNTTGDPTTKREKENASIKEKSH